MRQTKLNNKLQRVKMVVLRGEILLGPESLIKTSTWISLCVCVWANLGQEVRLVNEWMTSSRSSWVNNRKHLDWRTKIESTLDLEVTSPFAYLFPHFQMNHVKPPTSHWLMWLDYVCMYVQFITGSGANVNTIQTHTHLYILGQKLGLVDDYISRPMLN